LALTSVRWVILAAPFRPASTISAEFMNCSSSQACWGNLVFGLIATTPPPDIETKSWPLTPAPGFSAGISA
jgi:hypothetical protein